jgi:hypothetical protein
MDVSLTAKNYNSIIIPVRKQPGKNESQVRADEDTGD